MIQDSILFREYRMVDRSILVVMIEPDAERLRVRAAYYSKAVQHERVIERDIDTLERAELVAAAACADIDRGVDLFPPKEGS